MDKGYRLTLDAPCYGCYAICRNAASGRRYEAYSQRIWVDADGQYDNTPWLLILFKMEKAQGFDDFTQWALTPRMANSETEIQTFLAGLLFHVSAQQGADLEAFAKVIRLDQLQPWDVGFYPNSLSNHMPIQMKRFGPICSWIMCWRSYLRSYKVCKSLCASQSVIPGMMWLIIKWCATISLFGGVFGSFAEPARCLSCMYLDDVIFRHIHRH